MVGAIGHCISIRGYFFLIAVRIEIHQQFVEERERKELLHDTDKSFGIL